jgi:hypothetical protein
VIEKPSILVHIHRGKGAKDRLVPLPQSTLHVTTVGEEAAIARINAVMKRNP